MSQYIAAGEIQDHFLTFLNEVKETGNSIVVTQDGKPVAQLVPFTPEKSLKGSVKVVGDIINIIDPDEWEMNRDDWELEPK